MLFYIRVDRVLGCYIHERKELVCYLVCDQSNNSYFYLDVTMSFQVEVYCYIVIKYDLMFSNYIVIIAYYHVRCFTNSYKHSRSRFAALLTSLNCDDEQLLQKF